MGLILVKTVCKGYQQAKLVGKELKCKPRLIAGDDNFVLVLLVQCLLVIAMSFNPCLVLVL